MRVGFGRGIITPKGGKTAIAGNIPPRLTDVVHDDVLAVAMVVACENTRTIWVSCDICHPNNRLMEDAIIALKKAIPDFDESQLVLNATHATACAYVTDDEFLDIGLKDFSGDMMPLCEVRKQICEGIVCAVQKALSNMHDCTMEFSTADILTGYCRRVVYNDLSAVMYGNPYREDFLRMEYPDSLATKLLYFYTKDEHRLLGIFANVPCPSQADECSLHITGDYWTVVRNRVNEAFGKDVEVISACASAGELSPHRVMYSVGGYTDDIENGPEAAERLGNFIAESIIKEKERPLKKYSAEELKHKRIIKALDFPVRKPCEKDINDAIEYFKDKENFDETGKPKSWVKHVKYSLIKNLTNEKPRFYNAKVCVMKIANVLFFTAPMEVFTEYSKRISMKFPHNPTFDVQLTYDYMGYLPTNEAIEHGGYSTEIFSTITGADGGKMYIEEISKLLNKIRGD